MKDFAIISDNRLWGTSRNAGSDKQTYYRIHATGRTGDSAYEMASALFSSGSTDGDTAYAEAALSLECFYNLVRIGVPFPRDEYGDYPGYKTDHDEKKRGTSAGPYTSRIMTEKLEKEKNLQRIILEIRKKYGKNAILKGTSLQDGATARERHQQIGGHRA